MSPTYSLISLRLGRALAGTIVRNSCKHFKARSAVSLAHSDSMKSRISRGHAVAKIEIGMGVIGAACERKTLPSGAHCQSDPIVLLTTCTCRLMKNLLAVAILLAAVSEPAWAQGSFPHLGPPVSRQYFQPPAYRYFPPPAPAAVPIPQPGNTTISEEYWWSCWSSSRSLP